MPDNFFNLNHPDFWGIVMRFVINLFFLFMLIRVVYFRYSKKEKFLFSFFLMGIMIFFIGSMLTAVVFLLTAAVGFFAVFTILRFRTRNFSIKDMSYIFTVIGISTINSLKIVGFPLLGILIMNSIIIFSAYVLEEYLVKNKCESQSIIYDDLELLKHENNKKLLKDLSTRTGKDIVKVRIRRINFKRDRAALDIYFKE
jgi:hypothetical protein